MPKSKSKRGQRAKRTRLRLVMDFCSDAGTTTMVHRYADKPRRWRGLIEVEYPGGVIHEYQVNPDSPVELSEFIKALKGRVADFVDDSSIRFALKIFIRA